MIVRRAQKTYFALGLTYIVPTCFILQRQLQQLLFASRSLLHKASHGLKILSGLLTFSPEQTKSPQGHLMKGNLGVHVTRSPSFASENKMGQKVFQSS